MSAVRPLRLTDDPYARSQDGWAIRAEPPGDRDLGSPDLWDRSLERSRRRREATAARRPGLAHATPAKVSAALVTATLLAPSASQTAQAARTSTAQVGDAGVLQRGSSGDGVRALQRALGIGSDGVFGPATAKAVRAFQREKGLAVDGVVGPQTRRALGLSAKQASKGSPVAKRRSLVAAPASGMALDRTAVKALQRALGVSADGAVGPRTRSAIRRAEQRAGLPVDGRPDAQLLAALGVTPGGTTDADPGAPQDEAAAGAPAPAGKGAAAAVEAARAQVGKPYASGGNGPSAFDCSGLTVQAFKAAGISLPRTSFDQYGQGRRVAKSQIQAGDLVFFSTNGAGASHVGIATGPTTAISATTKGVMEHSFGSGYWAEHFVGARRVG